MYSDPLSTTTPAVVGVDNTNCVKWRETLPSQEESAGRDIPMGQLVTEVLVSHESPLPPYRPVTFGLTTIVLSRGVEIPVPTGVHTLAWTATDECREKPREKKIGRVWCGQTQFQ